MAQGDDGFVTEAFSLLLFFYPTVVPSCRMTASGYLIRHESRHTLVQVNGHNRTERLSTTRLSFHETFIFLSNREMGGRGATGAGAHAPVAARHKYASS